MFNTRKIRDYLSFFALLGFFWFYPAYSILRSLGVPSIALPLFLYLLTIIIILLSIISALKFGILKSNPYTAAVITLFLYVLAVQFFSYWSLSREYQEYYFQRSQMSFAYSTLCLVIGLNINNIINIYKSSKVLRIIFVASYAFLLGTVTYSIISNWQSSGQFQIVYTIDYLMIADGLAVALLVLFILKRNPLLSIASLILISSTLSRGVMISWIGSIVLYYFLKEKTSIKKMSVVALAIIIGVSSFLYIKNSPQSFIELFGANRATEILVEFTTYGFDFEDPSRKGREIMQEQGIADLENVWLFGQYLRELETGLGYIHNWLSFWIAYGILPFLMFCFLYVILLVKVFFRSKVEMDIRYKFILIISIYTLIQIVLFRSYFYPLVWFSLAGLSKVLDESKTSKTP